MSKYKLVIVVTVCIIVILSILLLMGRKTTPIEIEHISEEIDIFIPEHSDIETHIPVVRESEEMDIFIPEYNDIETHIPIVCEMDRNREIELAIEVETMEMELNKEIYVIEYNGTAIYPIYSRMFLNNIFVLYDYENEGKFLSGVLMYDTVLNEVIEFNLLEIDENNYIYDFVVNDNFLYFVESPKKSELINSTWQIVSFNFLTSEYKIIDASSNYVTSILQPRIAIENNNLVYGVGMKLDNSDNGDYKIILYEENLEEKKEIFKINNLINGNFIPVICNDSIYFPDYKEGQWFLNCYDLKEQIYSESGLQFTFESEYPKEISISNGRIAYVSSEYILYSKEIFDESCKIVDVEVSSVSVYNDTLLYSSKGKLFYYNIKSNEKVKIETNDEFYCVFFTQDRYGNILDVEGKKENDYNSYVYLFSMN